MLNTRFRCRFGDVYSCFCCCGHSGTVPLFYMFPSGFSWRKTTKFIRKCNFMLTCAETHSNVAETWIFIFPSTSSYLNVHGNTRSRSGNTFFSTEILGYFSETDFCLISADEFRSRVDGNTRFCSRNTFFSCFLYISDSFSTPYSWSSFFITGQVNMFWSCGFI